MGNYLSVFYDRIWPQVDKSSRNTPIGLTQVQNESFGYFWIVKNFSQLKEYSVKSPEFTGGNGHKWRLDLHPKEKIDGEEKIGIYLEYLGFKKINANFKITLAINGYIAENSSPEVYEFKKGNIFFPYSDISWGWDFLKYPENIENDQILIDCKICLKNLATSQLIDDKLLNSMLPPEYFCKMYSDFGKLWKNPKDHWDLSILVGGRDFKVHKAILSARSPVFSRMLTTNKMYEAQGSTISIDNFDPEIVENMLEFIYTGETVIDKNVLDLLHLSDMYDLLDLKGRCEIEIVKNLTFENALELLDIGTKFNAPLLESLAADFILGNDENVTKNPPGFKDNLKNHNQLSLEILSALLLERKTQEKRIKAALHI